MKKLLILLFTLSACCNRENENGCTKEEMEQIHAEARLTTEPQFVAAQNNVYIYRIWTIEPKAQDHWTYFTTPCGDVSAQIQYSQQVGRVHIQKQIPANVNGTGCK